MLSLLFLVVFPCSVLAAPPPSAAVLEEKIYRDYQKRLLSRSYPKMKRAPSERLARVSLDAIEDLLGTGLSLPFDQIIPPAIAEKLPPRERARWFRLKGTRKKNTALEERALAENLKGTAATPGLLYELLGLQSGFTTEEARSLVARAADELPAEASLYARLKARVRTFAPPSIAEVKALFTLSTGKPSLYMFCRHNRSYKCLLVLRDRHGQPVRQGSSLWSQPALGLSARGLPFNVRNGYTPSGVHLINGVMPEANMPLSYGKHRRLILDFVPRSPGEGEQRKLLPEAAHASDWWKEAMVARDIGRTELRIHGTGERSSDAEKPYYPFVPTVGCVAQRELKYGSTNFNDQRLLLDLLMRAGGRSPAYANEALIQGVLYVIELDNRGSAVGLSDLARYGIL